MSRWIDFAVDGTGHLVVQRRMAGNPYRRDRAPVDDALIAAWLRRNYVDAEPWPFGALLT